MSQRWETSEPGLTLCLVSLNTGNCWCSCRSTRPWLRKWMRFIIYTGITPCFRTSFGFGHPLFHQNNFFCLANVNGALSISYSNRTRRVLWESSLTTHCFKVLPTLCVWWLGKAISEVSFICTFKHCKEIYLNYYFNM